MIGINDINHQEKERKGPRMQPMIFPKDCTIHDRNGISGESRDPTAITSQVPCEGPVPQGIRDDPTPRNSPEMRRIRISNRINMHRTRSWDGEDEHDASKGIEVAVLDGVSERGFKDVDGNDRNHRSTAEAGVTRRGEVAK